VSKLKIKKMQAECDAFNAKYPIGTHVFLKKDFVDEPVKTSVIHAAKNHEKKKLLSLTSQKKTIKEMNDSAICGYLCNRKRISRVNITFELIEVKRLQITLHRLIKEKSVQQSQSV